MKRGRLEPAPYTKEDADIWVFVGLFSAFGLNDTLERNSARVDRADADSMLFFMQMSITLKTLKERIDAARENLTDRERAVLERVLHS